MDVLSARSKFFFYNTMVSLLKALEGKVVTIEIRNNVTVTGKIDTVESNMSINLSNVILKDVYSRQSAFDKFFLRGRQIVYVQIPDEIDIVRAMTWEINKKEYFQTRERTQQKKIFDNRQKMREKSRQKLEKGGRPSQQRSGGSFTNKEQPRQRDRYSQSEDRLSRRGGTSSRGNERPPQSQRTDRFSQQAAGSSSQGEGSLEQYERPSQHNEKRGGGSLDRRGRSLQRKERVLEEQRRFAGRKGRFSEQGDWSLGDEAELAKQQDRYLELSQRKERSSQLAQRHIQQEKRYSHQEDDLSQRNERFSREERRRPETSRRYFKHQPSVEGKSSNEFLRESP